MSQLLYALASRKARESFVVTTVPPEQKLHETSRNFLPKISAWLHALLLYQNHLCTVFCPYLWSSLSELSEVLTPRLQSSHGPHIKLNVKLSCCAFFFSESQRKPLWAAHWGWSLRVQRWSQSLANSASWPRGIRISSWRWRLPSVSHSIVSDSLQPHGLQHARLPYPSLSPGVCSNSCPLSQWCHPIIFPSIRYSVIAAQKV